MMKQQQLQEEEGHEVCCQIRSNNTKKMHQHEQYDVTILQRRRCQQQPLLLLLLLPIVVVVVIIHHHHHVQQEQQQKQYYNINPNFFFCYGWLTSNAQRMRILQSSSSFSSSLFGSNSVSFIDTRSTGTQRQKKQQQYYYHNPLFSTTPFVTDMYDNPYEGDDSDKNRMGDDNNNNNIGNFISVDENTKLVVGINKYSHDTSICVADASTGNVLYGLAKERLVPRKKHDAGNVVSLIESCLSTLPQLSIDSIQTIIMNNHHHRIIPIESNIQQMEWEYNLRMNGGAENGYTEIENLIPQHNDDTTSLFIRHELSHHLAHAYSTVTQAPFDNGLCVIMDGMGESYRTMYHALTTNDPTYTSDLSFGINSFQCIPSNLPELIQTSIFDYREAESVYRFIKNMNNNTLTLYPIFKRYIPENTPPSLYNHGFDNMDSIGALYSRVSTHIFGDWNACGKVMGLAPWSHYQWTIDTESSKNTKGKSKVLQPKLFNERITWGKLYSEDEATKFQFNKSLVQGIPYIARSDPDLFNKIDGTMKKRYDFDENYNTDDEEFGRRDASSNDNNNNNKDTTRLPVQVALDAIALASRIQIDLQDVVIDFIKYFQTTTQENNICLAGGVVLNSVMNGIIARELNFQQTFIPPYPGDDGISVGCCAFGLFPNPYLPSSHHHHHHPTSSTTSDSTDEKPKLWDGPLSPYLGPTYSEQDIKMAIQAAEPWLEVERVRDIDERLDIMVTEVQRGGVIAWYHSRSEFGPRALGHRSILADPRRKGLVRFINEHVKSRESFRPFAPSVLSEEAGKWFDFGPNAPSDGNISPFMSMTAAVYPDLRSKIPAVTHVDGSSRIQTVTKQDEPLYHKFISKFFQLTGIPMVLNTSFNTIPSEPIVETPSEAIRSFLYSMGSIELLVLGDYVIRRKKPNLQKLLGEITKDGTVITPPVCPKRAGPVQFQTSFDLDNDTIRNDDNDDDSVQTITKVRMTKRPLHHDTKNAWVELLDELEGEILGVCDGTVTLNEIMAQYSTASSEDDDTIIDPKEHEEATQNLLQNIVHRMVRLYEETLIGW